MFRIVVGLVVASVVTFALFFPFIFIGILMTTQGKGRAPTDIWIFFGSIAIGTFVGGCCFAAIAKQFSRDYTLFLIGLYTLLFMPVVSADFIRIAIAYRIAITVVVISLTVVAGGYLCGRRKSNGQAAKDDVAVHEELKKLAERGGMVKVRVELTLYLSHDAIRGDLEGAGFLEIDERTPLERFFAICSVSWEVTGVIDAARIEELAALSFVKSVEAKGSMDDQSG